MFDDRIGNLQKMLARMGPEGRQKYAADHADDPIAVSMALFVNNIAKEIKEGKRGEPEIQAPVVQQAIQAMNQPKMPQGMPPQGMPPQGQPQAPQQGQPQGMPPQGMPPPQGQTQMAADGGYMDSRLPEEMGIGALPERSLSGMADGGIVGFSGAAESLVRSHTGGKDYFLDIPETIRDPSVPYYRMIPNPLASLAGRKFGSYDEAVQAYDNALYDPAKATRRDQYTNKNTGPDAPNATPSIATMPTDATRRGDVRFPVADTAPPTAARPTGVPPAAGAPSAGATTGATTGASSNTSGLASLASQYDNINTKGMSRADILAAREQFESGIAAIDPVRTQREELAAKSKKFSQDALDEFEKETKDRPDPYAKREERANKQEASIAESAERNPYLSLMEAGFAMMAGTSQYAFENIGKGAMVGTKAYKEGLDKIELAKTKLSETRDKIEDYRINRDDLTTKERRAFKTDIRNTELAGDKLMMDGMALAFNNKREDVNKALEAYQTSHNNEVNRRTQADIAKINELGAGQRTMYSTDAQVRMSNADRASRETVAANALSALSPEARLAKLLGNGDLETGLRKLQEISADKSGAVYAQMFAKEVADARKEFREPPSAEEYAKSIRAFLNVFKPTVVDDSKVKGSPTVYPRPSP